MKVEYVDVLIIGAGPAGLMAGSWMAKTGIKAIIVDKKPSNTPVGHADGLESRTLEILDSFEIGEPIWKRANRTIDLSLWDDFTTGGLERRAVETNCNQGLSRFQEATLGQPQIEKNFLQYILTNGNVKICWNTVPIKLDLLEHTDYPIRVQTQTGPPGKEINENSIQAKYLIGCDGAHSWLRAALGLGLEGDGNNEHWGVLDGVPITDFPDIRKRCIIKAAAGHLMIIPRERRLVRFYIQLSAEIAQSFKSTFDPSILIKILKDILYPYKIDVNCIEWSTIYSVAQRLCPTFSKFNRVFLAGDAIHTHSPKAGQGMNVSIQDSYNLGWKLASVIKGRADPCILRTYQDERLPIALRLIAFDKRMVEGIRERKPLLSDSTLSGEQKFTKTLREENTTASGLGAQYKPNCMISKTWDPKSRHLYSPLLPCSKADLAINVKVGTRLNDAEVLYQSDSSPCSLQKLLRSTGEWYLLVFGGTISESSQMKRVQRLGSTLSTGSFLGKLICRPRNDRVGAVGTYLIHCASRRKFQMSDFPTIFTPFDEELGYDYWRVLADNKFCGEQEGGAHELYGIGTEGCLILVRPDQHVAFIGALEDVPTLELFLADFLKV